MAEICVLGLGYVGLPTASLLAGAGFHVMGVDINPDVVKALNQGKTNLKEAGLAMMVSAAFQSRNLVAATEPEPSHTFIICVPTPTLPDHRVDLRAVESATRSILPHLRRGNLVILESTSPVGTTRDVVGRILAESGLEPGVDFDLCYCPERVLPGNTVAELVNNDRVIGGYTTQSAEAAKAIYERFCQGKLTLTDDKTAELCKLMENTYRDVNIALANVFANICESEGIDVWKAIQNANLHPRVKILNPGPGVGGHCIPVDPWFLIQQYPQHTQLLRAARLVNDGQGVRMLDRLMETDRLRAGDKLTILGASYKADIDDPRESPAYLVADAAHARGVKVAIHDPLVVPGTYHGHPVTNDLTGALTGAAAAMLITDHKAYRSLSSRAFTDAMTGRLIADTRLALNHASLKLAGFTVLTTGIGESGEAKAEPAAPQVIITDAAKKTLSRV
ncbi:MAG: nucleotide sugar dehydrogenase [Planctomycetes bacterium]|nr:nucleotide sugar dehydrogenase [Planctomycetota bacterium]